MLLECSVEEDILIVDYGCPHCGMFHEVTRIGSRWCPATKTLLMPGSYEAAQAKEHLLRCAVEWLDLHDDGVVALNPPTYTERVLRMVAAIKQWWEMQQPDQDRQRKMWANGKERV